MFVIATLISAGYLTQRVFPRSFAHLGVLLLFCASSVHALSPTWSMALCFLGVVSWYLDSHRANYAMLVPAGMGLSLLILLATAGGSLQGGLDPRYLASLAALLTFLNLSIYVARTRAHIEVIAIGYKSGALLVSMNAAAAVVGLESNATNRFYDATSSFGGTRLSPLLASAPDELACIALVVGIAAFHFGIGGSMTRGRLPHLVALVLSVYLLYRLNYRVHVLLLLGGLLAVLVRRSGEFSSRNLSTAIFGLAALPLLWLSLIALTGSTVGRLGSVLPGISRNGDTTIDEIVRLNGRVDIWQSAIHSVETASTKQLLFGVGHANQSSYGDGIVDPRHTELANFRDVDLITAHNSALQTAVEFGLLGVGLWILMAVKAIPKGRKSSEGQEHRLLLQLMLVSLFAAGAVSTTLTIESSENMMLFVLLGAIAMAGDGRDDLHVQNSPISLVDLRDSERGISPVSTPADAEFDHNE